MTMTPATVVMLMLAFQVKHLLADFVLQTGAMVQRKGVYGDPVGAAHSLVHAVLTLAVLLAVGPLGALAALGLALAEFVVHYHTDWAKDHLQKRAGYTAQQKGYWVLLGLDQFFHQITYVIILGVLVAGL
jgi:hypothetical protein